MNKKFEDIIAEQGRLVYTSVGNSMYPLIKPRDLLVIEAVKQPLKVGDVPLYKRDSGQYVLHRIVEINKGKYTTKGDNRTLLEKGVTEKQIIGVLTSIIRGGKTFPAETLEEYTARNADDLIYLISCAVNGDPPDAERVKKMDLAEIYRLSMLHTLTSAVSFALEKAVPLPRAFDQARKKAIRKLTLFDVERAEITRELENAGIWYLPLKGVILKSYYPKAAMREMTDNDILIDPSRADDVRDIMTGLGYTCDSFGVYHHDTYSKPPTLDFEMHRRLFEDFQDPLLNAYYADIGGKLRRDGLRCSMSDEDFYLYMLSHTYKHYSHGGSGLRSLLDVYVFLRAHPDLDREYLDAELEKLHMTGFEEMMRRLSEKIYTGAQLNEHERDDLTYFINSGSIGTNENMEYNSTARSLGNDDSKASKRRFLMSRVFISGEALEQNYPFVAKHKALYPLLLVYRPVKGAFTHPKGILNEYRKIKRFKKKER